MRPWCHVVQVKVLTNHPHLEKLMPLSTWSTSIPFELAGLLLHCYTLAKSVLVLQCPMALRSWLTKPPPCTRYYVVVPPCLYHRLLMRPRCHMLYVKGLTNHPYLIELMPSSIEIAGHHSFRPNLSGHSQSDHLSLAISHSGHQSLFSEPREKTLSGRSNRRQKTFTAGNFSANFSANFPATVFFYTARSAWRRSPIFPKHRTRNHPRAVHARFSGRRLHLTRRRVRAREPLSGDALPPPGSPDADQPPFYLFVHPSPARASFGVLLLPRALDQFFRRPRLFFLNSNPCTCLGKCSSTFPVHDKIRNGIITSIQRHVTRNQGADMKFQTLGGSDSSPILITGHKLKWP
ncbi:hypothetical protein CK203_014503 [Vitis vinifera]|uniref:Uncharacterized protein n=1 Tax=Vitis vinifera TaxID=29760 RepID=A0A438K4U3_VITVI|nr:hypothetical protein CK203_014503 [Vitis vinifera]